MLPFKPGQLQPQENYISLKKTNVERTVHNPVYTTLCHSVAFCFVPSQCVSSAATAADVVSLVTGPDNNASL